MKHNYAGSNSSLGFYSRYEEIFADLQHVHILKGGPGTGKSTLIGKVGNAFAEKGYMIEFLHNPSDDDSLDGVIIPLLEVGIVNGTTPHVIDPKYPNVVDCIVNLGDFCDRQRLAEHKEKIIALTDKVAETFSKTYETYAKAREAHDELEEIYVQAMDFPKADQATADLIKTIFPEALEPEPNPIQKHRFSAAATRNGPQNFYENLTEDVNNRYIIKGRAGSGKSTTMKKIGQHAEKLGLAIEYYHCAFDPEGIDMVLIPKLSTAVLDGTPPHPVEATRETDEIFDTFKLYIDRSVEVERTQDIREAKTSYKYLMQRAMNHLRDAMEMHDELKKYYMDAMDFTAVDRKTIEIIQELIMLAEPA